MKRKLAVMTMVRNRLLQPVGPLSKDLAPYDPPDKPILCYEQLLYLIALGGTVLAKALDYFVNSASEWSPLHVIALVLAIAVILVAAFNLLFPPRLSASRLVFVILTTIWLVVLISPRY